MKILVVGSGAREHSFCRVFVDYGHEVIAAPGREGLWEGVSSIPINATDIAGLLVWARQNKPDLVVVGPEDPLVAGFADYFKKSLGIPVFGPSMLAALNSEGSKVESKARMVKAKIPTARYWVSGSYSESIAYITGHALPLVVKVDGLAAGKGVKVCHTNQEATEFLRSVFINHTFGVAGDKVLIEEFLPGEELSVLAFCDGKNCLMLPPSRDFKPAYDHGEGPNTGGMGAISPVPEATLKMMEIAKQKIILPFLAALADEGNPFVGCLYAGLKIHPTKGLMVLEYNCRPGDPETSAILRRLNPQVDLAGILLECAEGRLGPMWEKRESQIWTPEHAISVVMATKGYPNQNKADYGKIITGIGRALEVPTIQIFDAGTKLVDGNRVNAGGRVLNVTAVGQNLPTARQLVYSAIKRIGFPEGFYRTDIGLT